ncbi:hypothetical protein HPB51_003383 [Rhipicephalus microplus]|uniref:Uncharacterized protein n=1 Tax=Rhipicephalus microplus TaxID=6941 RepID=A0A9J6D3V3_RHIMP|nr:hypothetical protein HPB51_003383 [Rhipicephalus microplus]
MLSASKGGLFNNIWLHEFMFEVLEYVLPPDFKRHLTYFSWSPRSYDDLQGAMLHFYGNRHHPCPSSYTAASASSPFETRPPSQPVHPTSPPATTGHTGDGDHPSAPIDPQFGEACSPAVHSSCIQRASFATSLNYGFDAGCYPVHLEFVAETFSAAHSALGNSTTPAKPAHSPAECMPVSTPVEAHNTTKQDSNPTVRDSTSRHLSSTY